MTLKHLSIAQPNFTTKHYQFYHVPIDSYLIKAILADSPNIKLQQLCSFGQTNIKHRPKPVAAWSKISNYDTYLEFQKAFRQHYQHQSPLDVKFRLWQQQKATP